MRLIDADVLIKNRSKNDPVRIAAESSPTVYDIDSVSDVMRTLLSPFLTEKQECMLQAIDNIIKNGMCKEEQ